MGSYRLETVETPGQIRKFLDLPKRIYADNHNWVCPLDSDIESRFDSSKNELFENGDAIRWLVFDDKGQAVGRIAAFFNREVAAMNEQPTGGCGFFESINNQQVADMLFDASGKWLEEHGMEAMDGPVNFGDRDQWWGLLVEGFEIQPLYANNYNPPYYKELFENYGFQNYFDQHTYSRKISSGIFNPSVYERVKRLNETPGYKFEYIGNKDLKQVADDFRLIYNKAWATIPGVKPMDSEHTNGLMRRLAPIMDRKLIYFAYFNDEPIGFFIMIPDLNRILNPLKGKLNWFNALRLLFMLKLTKKADRIFGIIFGVAPEFQGKGIESGMIYAFEQSVSHGEAAKYKSLELAWIGDFNPLMMRVVENYVCGQRFKRHTTYRYLFDRSKPFTRCPRMGGARTK